MKTLTIIILLALATFSQAEEIRITETSDGIIVENTAPSSESVNPKAGETSANADSSQNRKEYLVSQIAQLRNEVAELTRPVDIEDPEQLTTIRALVDEKENQISRYEEELRQMN
jgi:hypothetical protein